MATKKKTAPTIQWPFQSATNEYPHAGIQTIVPTMIPNIHPPIFVKLMFTWTDI